MLERVSIVNWGRGNHVEVFTDGYAYNPLFMSLHLISLAGNDSAVKAVSAAIVNHREVTIHRADESDLNLTAHYGISYRILSVKLNCGAVHQIVADERFFHASDHSDRLLIVPSEQQLSAVIYHRVLSHIASPLIPEWAGWICSRLSEERYLRELEATVKVVEVHADEGVLDRIVSQGLEQKQISLSDRGGSHVGCNQ